MNMTGNMVLPVIIATIYTYSIHYDDFNYKKFIRGIIGGVILVLLSITIQAITRGGFDFNHRYLSMKWYEIINVVLIAPILEELIYRKYLYDHLFIRTIRMPKLYAFMLSLLLFILSHNVIEHQWLYIVASLPLYYAYEYGDNEHSSTTIHILNNLLAII